MNDKLDFPAYLSFWEIKEYFNRPDLLIIGSGIVGLSTAIYYKRKHPKKQVLVVERGFIPSGASTKNAGFACFGSISELLSDLKHSSENEVFSLVEERLKGLQLLRKLIGDSHMDYQACGGYEVFGKKDEELFEQCMAFLPKLNEQLKTDLGLSSTYTPNDSDINAFGFNNVEHLIKNQFEGAIDTGKMMNNMLQLARSEGITILNGLEASGFEAIQNGVCVQFKNGLNINCKHLHIATNGFALSLLPNRNVLPARAQVLITAPISDLKVRGTFHMNEGYYYFRNVGERILFGGGRQLEIENETTTELEVSVRIQKALENILQKVILPNTPYKIEHRWAGIMGVGKEKKTILEHISPNVSCAVRLGGMGIAIGTSIGKRSADMIG